MASRPSMMHSRLLVSFLTTAEHLNITAAAKALNVTQPALTRSIKQLEANVGTSLFDRLPGGVALTRQGEILARRVKLMELEYRHALSEINALQHGQTGEIRIGAGPVWTSTILPPVIAAFHRQFPNVKVTLTSGVINTLVPALLDGNMDLICANLDFPAQAEVIKEPLISISHAVIAHEDHPIFEKPQASAHDLWQFAWLVLTNDHVGTSRIASYFLANDLEPPKIAVETTSVALFKLLQCDHFLAHTSSRMLPDAALYGLKPVNHGGTFWEGEAGLAYRRTNNPVPALNSFISILRTKLSEEAD